MNKREIRKLICAMTIGDGHLDRRGAFIMEHSIKQEDYASWKADLIDNIFIDKKLSKRCCRRLTRQRVKGKFYDGYRVELWWKDYLADFLWERTYQFNGFKSIKNIEYLLSEMDKDIHTAIWFADDGGEMNIGVLKDGTLRRPWYGLFTYGFTEGQTNLTIEWFKTRFGEKPNKTFFKPRNSYYLRFHRDYAQEIFTKCEPYFKDIESLKKKFNYSFLTFGKGSETKENTPVKG
jgi:hypothetical protein